MGDISFQINTDVTTMWNTWACQSYKNVAEAICEFIDNSIQAGAGKNGVRINTLLDKDGQRWVHIEDGGSWGMIDSTTLSKCFNYGKPRGMKKVGLNEHNVGFKHALAYMDTTNTRWKIQIRQDGRIWELCAPYSHKMSLKMVDTYDGQLTCPSSTFIKIPLDKAQFNTLYERNIRTEPNVKLLLDRLRLILERHWMMKDEIIKKNIPLVLNDEPIEPYDILRDTNVDIVGGAKHKKVKLGADENVPEIDIYAQTLYLKPSFRKDDPLFRRGIKFCGVYIFKHGRFIKGGVFEDIYGRVADGHYTGFIVLVNITGDDAGLPPTFTTKNNFTNQDDKIQILYDTIKDMCPAIGSSEIHDQGLTCEKTLMEHYRSVISEVNKKAVKNGDILIYPEHVAKLCSNQQPLSNRDKMDVLIVHKKDKTVTIVEGKVNPLGVEDLRQLYVYYRNISQFCPDYIGYTVEAKFMAVTDDLSQAYHDELTMLKHLDPTFQPDIELFADYNIHRRKH